MPQPTVCAGRTRQRQAFNAGLVVIVEGMLDAMFDQRELRPEQYATQQEETYCPHHASWRAQLAQVPRTS